MTVLVHAAVEDARSGPCRRPWRGTSPRRRRAARSSARRVGGRPARCRCWRRRCSSRSSRSNGSRSASLDALRRPRRASRDVADAVEQHRELVAAQPGDGVAGADAAARSRCATATSSRSPTWWPRLSLTILKRSRSRNRTASGRSGWRAGRASALVEAVEEQRAVGQAGQRVVQGVVLRGCCSACLRSVTSVWQPTTRTARPWGSRTAIPRASIQR